MATYSIRDLEKLTGIKAHTIRIWEQRYGMITPARTQTNIRCYTDDDLRLLLNIAFLNRHGVKISKLAKMNAEDIAAKCAEFSQNKTGTSSGMEALTLSMIDLDEVAFERAFAGYVEEHGFEAGITELAYPFLDKLSVLWLTNSINQAHEKFIENLIRRKLLGAIDQLTPAPVRAGGLIMALYLPDGQSGELPLLFTHYLARARQICSIYLGAGITLNELRDVCYSLRPDFVCTMLQEPIPRHTVQGYIDEAARCAAPGALLLSGAQLSVGPLRPPENTRLLNNFGDTTKFLDELNRNGKLPGMSVPFL